MIRTVFGSNKSGTALIPIFSTINMALNISTRSGNSVITMGDGSSAINRTNLKFNDFTDGLVVSYFSYNYSTAFTGNISIKFLKGLKDVYSIRLGVLIKQSPNYPNRNAVEKYNITDLETFFAQFPNLYSVYIDQYAYQDSARMSVIKGDLAKFPNSVEKVLLNSIEIINVGTDLVLNFSNYTNTSQLKSFYISTSFGSYAPKILGDLGKLPNGCNYLNLQKAAAGSEITYTAGKVWASSFDTLYLPIGLVFFENDNLLNDLKNSVTTAIGNKVIYLGGAGSYRTSASDSAVTYLTGLGFTITGVSVIVPLKILDLPLQNSFTDVSPSGISMVAGNVNGFPSFVSDGSGGYAVDFGGTKSIKTAVNLPLSTSDKVTIVFEIKSSMVARGAIIEVANPGSTNGFFIDTNADGYNIEVADYKSAYNVGGSVASISSFTHVVIVIDRSLGTAQNKMYINKVFNYSNLAGYTNDLSGNFAAAIYHIGQRNGSSTNFIGQLKNLQIYNYPLSAAEIAAL